MPKACLLYTSYHAKQGAQVIPGEVADIIAIHEDRALIDIIKTHQQFHHCRFSGARWPYNGHLLPRFYTGAEIVDNDFIRVIPKVDVCKLYASLDVNVQFCIRRIVIRIYMNGMLGLWNLFFLVEELKYAFCRRRSLLQHIGDICHLGNRLGKAADILDKCLYITDVNAPAYRQVTAQNTNDYIAQIACLLYTSRCV